MTMAVTIFRQAIRWLDWHCCAACTLFSDEWHHAIHLASRG